MKIFTMLLTVAAFTGCGDNLKPGNGNDGGNPGGSDAAGIPPAPQLGTEIDRMGRPAINTALNHGFDGSAASAGAAKDNYNQQGSPSGWAQFAPEFAKNLAILDSLDNVCGNQALYDMGTGTTAGSDSYAYLATILTDDELNLDTTVGTCDIPTTHQNYLGVEFAVATGVPNTVCGGRAPTNDVMSTTYTVVAVGVAGFSGDDFMPAINDGATVHADVSNDTFPFLGTPH